MKKEYSAFELAVKIGEARAIVNSMPSSSSYISHRDSCPVECDPEGYAPCNCGASKANSGSSSWKKRLLDVLSL